MFWMFDISYLLHFYITFYVNMFKIFHWLSVSGRGSDQEGGEGREALLHVYIFYFKTAPRLRTTDTSVQNLPIFGFRSCSDHVPNFLLYYLIT